MYGRQPIFPSTIQKWDEEDIDDDPTKLKKLTLELAHRGAILRKIMPLAMRNLAIAQERDKMRFRFVRGGSYIKPKAEFQVGEYALVKQSKENSMDIAIPIANNTLQKWGKPVVIRSMSLYLTRFYT